MGAIILKIGKASEYYNETRKTVSEAQYKAFKEF